jgi:CBS domain-containing protein
MDLTPGSPTQRIYRGHGELSLRLPFCEPPAPALPQVATIADVVPACRIMTRDVICAREDLDVDALMELMVCHRLGCVPIVDERGQPVGMVTKYDLLERLVTAHDSEPAPPATVASQVMMPIAVTLDEQASVARAAAVMSLAHIHHVLIVAESGCLLGVVSTLDIVRWLAANDGMTEPAAAR